SVGLPSEDIDKFADTAAAARWIIDNYAIDTGRLYWAGQSAGSMAIWQILSRYPEIGTGFLASNGGISPQYDYSAEGLTQETIDATWDVLKVFAQNHIGLYIQFGEHDGSTNYHAAKYFYDVVSDYYRAEGLSEREIDRLVKFRVTPSEAYTVASGLTDHNVVRLMNWYPYNIIDMMDTVLAW
ncbi:MAG: hypothetical protein Q4D04_14050, partial [Clostridia bacterium]|nr:hypothetical protein [Clostridia bacterium]